MTEFVPSDVISRFIEGRDPQKYIVGVEGEYFTTDIKLIINDPNRGKKHIETKSLKPFIYCKPEAFKYLYGGNRLNFKRAMREYGVKWKKLRTTDSNGFEPDRLANGFTYMFYTSNPYQKLLSFFKEGGLDVFKCADSIKKIMGIPLRQALPEEIDTKLFMTLSPVEQYMIQSGKRLFKGFDSYDDLLRMHFDIETSGLDPKRDRIFQIGIKTNKGFEKVLEVKGDTKKEERMLERKAITNFFQIIDYFKPDIIAGYNSEFFDWDFILQRAEILGLDIKEIAKTLNPDKKLTRRDSTVKFGADTEHYQQTNMWGYSIIDIAHSVRKAQAINSEIKSWSLKYITKFQDANKPNRVYVDGDKIFTTWQNEVDKFAFNEENGDWYKITEEKSLQDGYVETTGSYIVERYLIDDLWETEKVDFEFNQAAFLLAKLVPASYMRSTTMGTAALWKTIMLAWSYENDLAIPNYEAKRDFTGGLSRLLETGYAKDVVKLDYAALYPNIELTHDIFPDLDISGVMKGMLLYIAETRDKYKALKNEYAEKGDKAKSNFYDTQQLPLKILANSFFGSFGAPYIFPWGDIGCAEETTCRGRQYLRLMVRHFHENYGFRPLVGDSVTSRTPVYIKYKDTNEIDILPIKDIFEVNKNTIIIDGQERDFNIKPFDILTKNGWTPIDYIYRHKTNKPIHRIETSESVIECTSDHSLFSKDGKEVKPSDLNRGDKLLLHDITINNCIDYADLSENKAWLIGFFVADGSSVYKNRKRNKYFSKRKQRVVTHNTTRCEWTLNNKDLAKLKRAKLILMEEYGIDASIKDYRDSSNVYKLKTHYATVSKLFSNECYCNNRIKKIPKQILNANKKVKKAFLDGFCFGDGYGDTMDECKDITQKSQTVLAGIALLSKELNYDYRIVSRKDKPNILNFNYKTYNGYTINNDKSIKKPDEVWNNYIIDNGDEYVYDISADGTFVAGIGNIVAHNTDGFNFAIPETVNEIKYLVKGNHRLTMSKAGQTLTGVDAVVADFNEKYMIGRMGLDIDDICTSTINFKRKNYANNILKGYDDSNNPKIKLKIVGNTVKSKSLPTYLEEFMDKGIRLLLDGNGYDFIELYYQYIDDLYNYRIPIAKLASKSKVKKTNSQYIEDCKKVNKAGNPMPRQAHMELILANNLAPGLGDVIYYYNTGTSKSHGDLKTVTDKQTGEKSIQLNCKMIPEEDLEKNPDLLVDDYNLPRYISSFNKRISGLLVCFSKEIRDRIIIDVKKDRKTKEFMLEEREFFSEEQCQLVAGEPLDEGDQDTYEALMTMEEKELKFWTSVNKLPNSTTAKQWAEDKASYLGTEPDYNEFEDEVLIVDDGVPQNREELKSLDSIEPMDKPNGIGILSSMDTITSVDSEELSYLEIVEIEKTGVIPDKYSMLSMEQILKSKASALERHISNLSN